MALLWHHHTGNKRRDEAKISEILFTKTLPAFSQGINIILHSRSGSIYSTLVSVTHKSFFDQLRLVVACDPLNYIDLGML